MEWWHFVLIGLGGLLVLFGGFAGIRRSTRRMRERIGVLKNALDAAIAADQEPEKPRSLSSLESGKSFKIFGSTTDSRAEQP